MKSLVYKRKDTVLKKDENDKPIPLKQKVKKDIDGVETEVEEIIPGKFETKEIWLRDAINLEHYLRVHTLADGKVVVILSDGHEETQIVPKLKNKGGRAVPGNIIEEKQRQWLQSEILIERPEDVEKLFSILES